MSLLRQSFMSSSGSADPYFSSVSLGLHFEGTNGSTTFTDVKGHTVTGTAGLTISTAQHAAGSSSGLFDGTKRLAVTATGSEFAFGSADFTMEAYVYQTTRATGVTSIVIGTAAATSSGSGAILHILPDGTLRFGSWLATKLDSSSTVPLNTQTHIEVSYVSGTLRMFIAGTLVGTFTGALNFTDTTCSVGGALEGTYGFIGYIDEARITKGVGRHTASFTPSAPFPDR